MGLFSKKAKEVKLHMPINGEVVSLDKVEDPVFSQRMMGDGFAIDPVDGKVHSPVDGVIATVFPTGHALGINVNDDVEVLIHIGLDTVNLGGEGFSVKVKEGDKISAGDLLVEFEYDAVKSKVPSIITPVIFTKLDNLIFEINYDKANVKDEIGVIKK